MVNYLWKNKMIFKVTLKWVVSAISSPSDRKTPRTIFLQAVGERQALGNRSLPRSSSTIGILTSCEAVLGFEKSNLAGACLSSCLMFTWLTRCPHSQWLYAHIDWLKLKVKSKSKDPPMKSKGWNWANNTWELASWELRLALLQLLGEAKVI